MTEINHEHNMQHCLSHLEMIDKVMKDYPDSLDKTFLNMKLKDVNLWVNNIIIMQIKKDNDNKKEKSKIEIAK